MSSQNPEVARTCDRRGRRRVDRGQLVFLIKASVALEDVDLTHLEAAPHEIELGLKFQDFGELERERIAIPCGVVSKAVERKAQGPQLSVGQVGQADDRHLAEA